jgi:hypothetical protein
MYRADGRWADRPSAGGAEQRQVEGPAGPLGRGEVAGFGEADRDRPEGQRLLPLPGRDVVLLGANPGPLDPRVVQAQAGREVAEFVGVVGHEM